MLAWVAHAAPHGLVEGVRWPPSSPPSPAVDRWPRRCSRRPTPRPRGSSAARRTRRSCAGGAWIGALERAAVAGTLLAGWPEGLAVVLAVKGLGRYAELRAPAAAERFIVGTLASGLWAVACVGIAFLVRT